MGCTVWYGTTNQYIQQHYNQNMCNTGTRLQITKKVTIYALSLPFKLPAILHTIKHACRKRLLRDYVFPCVTAASLTVEIFFVIVIVGRRTSACIGTTTSRRWEGKVGQGATRG